ncbi:MAG TPA: phosphatase PAP2 family protein [Acidimicrobiales bacterium]|nr:phosphatase PAP2 family protein [Acidimicrobiales bacterium]
MKGRVAAARRGVGQFDLAVDRAFDHIRGHPVADRAFYAASELGDFGLIWVMLGTIKGLRRGGDLEGALRMVAAIGVESILVNGIIKSFFRRTRPEWIGERPLRLRQPLTSSFPSGHATAGFSAAMMLSEDDPLAPLYFALAAFVAASRIHVKIHHASDVAGGVALGLLLGVLGRRVMPAPPER